MNDIPAPFETPTIVVQVKDGRYDCFGPDTPVGHFLVAVINELGGINETVEDGFYHFRAFKDESTGRLYGSLTRFEE